MVQVLNFCQLKMPLIQNYFEKLDQVSAEYLSEC